MPAVLDRCVSALIAKGKSKDAAWAICQTAFAEDPSRTEEEILARAVHLALKDYALPETFDVPGVEIFAVGTWNGDKYVENDLDEMVRAFRETHTKMKPYLKLGHGEEQGLLRSDELPAAGWVTNLNRSGKRLLADFTKVPKKIYDLMRKAAYRRVSSEIYWNFSLDGKKYPKMLKAVALLGGETPAVHDLEDIIGLYSLSGEMDFSSTEKPKTYEVDYEDLRKLKEGTDMPDPLETCHASLSEANKKLTEAGKEIEIGKKKMSEQEAELKKLSDQNAVLTKELSEIKTAKRHSEITAEVDKLITDKKIVPAQKEMLFNLLVNLPETSEKKYAVGDKSYGSLSEVAMAFVNASQPIPPTDGKSETGMEQKDLAEKAKKYAEEHKVSYREALIEVSKLEVKK